MQLAEKADAWVLASMPGLCLTACMVPVNLDGSLLYNGILMARAMQVMVFFSSCAAVKFHSELLNYIDMPVKDIHGKQKQVPSCCSRPSPMG